MTVSEFSNEFDVRFNNIDSNLSYSVSEYEKSLYLTRAQLEIVKNYFNPKGNKYQDGIDSSPKREIDLSCVISNVEFTAPAMYALSTSYSGLVELYVSLDQQIIGILNDSFWYNGVTDDFQYKTSVAPITYEQYQVILSKPYRNPPKRTSWRVMDTGEGAISDISGLFPGIRIIPSSAFDESKDFIYKVRFIKYPDPILLVDLSNGLTIDGVDTAQTSMLPSEIHQEILARAIELCKADYIGDLGAITQFNTRTE